MPGIHRRRDTFISTADSRYNDDGGEEEIPKSYCPVCQSLGFYNLLKERIYKPEELVNGQLPRDKENWLMCWTCGEIVPIVHAKQESEIAGIKDVPDNIHDIKRLYVEHFIKPRSATIRKNLKRINRTNPEEDDLDLQNLLDSNTGRQLTNYYSSNPD